MEFSAVDTIWVLLGTVLVFFMQAGFAMVETGFTRAKNSGNIIMKNIMDFSLGSLLFWFLGYSIMFNGDNPFIGTPDFFLAKGGYGAPDTVPFYAFVMFQTVFSATAATIVSGAMAERTKFSSYCLYSLFISGLIYPISGHWIWGGGFLAEMGFHDFAGSTTVHMVGGVAAIVGAKILGPRIGKYDKEGKPKAIPGHNLTLGALGVFILWFCWFGFNGGSTVSMEGDAIESAANIFMTTNIAASVAAFVVMALTWVRYKKPDVSMTLNGALGGLVGITAGCDVVSPAGAALIGLLCGIALMFGVEFVEKTLKIDDPVGASGVHGICGALGTILVGLLDLENGLLYGGGASLLGVQTLGVLLVIAWVGITSAILFTTIKKVFGLRVTKEEEKIGLDIEEHGLLTSYADFMPVSVGSNKSTVEVINEKVVMPEKVARNLEDGEEKITKFAIITNKDKFENLKATVEGLGIQGMTVTQVLGYGMQKGSKEFYRGIEIDTKLLPKIKVEIVVCNADIDNIVEEIKKSLFTGNIGDGKIFVYDAVNAIKVRTNEEGYSALC